MSNLDKNGHDDRKLIGAYVFCIFVVLHILDSCQNYWADLINYYDYRTTVVLITKLLDCNEAVLTLS